MDLVKQYFKEKPMSQNTLFYVGFTKDCNDQPANYIEPVFANSRFSAKQLILERNPEAYNLRIIA